MMTFEEFGIFGVLRCVTPQVTPALVGSCVTPQMLVAKEDILKRKRTDSEHE